MLLVQVTCVLTMQSEPRRKAIFDLNHFLLPSFPCSLGSYLFCLLLRSSPALHASSVVTSVACVNGSGNNYSTVLGSNSCTNSDNSAYSKASTDSTISITGNLLQVTSQASILAGGNDLLHPTFGIATAQITTTVQIGFPGASGQGLLFGSVLIDRISNGGTGMTTVQYSPDYFSQQFPGSPSYVYPSSIQLGAPFTITVTSSAAGGALPSQSAAGFLSGLTLVFSFTQLDGVTPVAIADVPEPGAISLIGLPLVAGWVVRRRRD